MHIIYWVNTIEDHIMANIVNQFYSISSLGQRLFGAKAGRASFTTPDVLFGGEADYRAKLLVPINYLSSEFTLGGAADYKIYNNGGIVFPYTPTITYENAANYATLQPMHSNYAMYFYKNSAISGIKVSAKFTVQNDDDAGMYLAVSHLIKSLTKMQTGSDSTPGAPPPVCRFSAYGDFMMKDVPVVISSFTQDLTSEVDYYAISSANAGSYSIYGTNFVPTVSTFNLQMFPVYSRNEQSEFSVSAFRDQKTLRKGGFL